MKESWQWDEDDILSIIRTAEKESLTLDFKECKALIRTVEKKKNELSKDVSAFANSAGGTLIYGVIENGHIPVEIDCGYDPQDISKEWLEQVINSRIHRRIDGVRINQVELKQTKPGKVLYVIYVPQSKRAPHMAHDKRYYKRYNFESIPMEDYEVRDVMNRNEGPDLDLVFSFGNNNTDLPLGQVELRINMINESPIPAEYKIVSLLFDPNIEIVSSGGFEDQGLVPYLLGEKYINVKRLYKNFAIPHHMPIWEGTSFTITSGPLILSIPQEENGRFCLRWELRSPKMVMKQGICYLTNHGNGFSLEQGTDIA